MLFRSLIKRSCVMVILLISSSVYASEIQLDKIVKWVKITSQFHYNDYYYFYSYVDNLESSVTNCGYGCEIVKLRTTPFTSAGTLNIQINNRCTKTNVKLPFITLDGDLVTPVKTYHAEIGSEYCGFNYVDVIVSRDPHAKSGYQINLNLIK